jgi:hypothetical protein
MTTLENYWKQIKRERSYKLTRAVTQPEFLVANTGMEVKAGRYYKVPVKPMKIPPHFVIHLGPYMVHNLGHVVGLGEKLPRPIDIERNIEHVMFLAFEDGEVKKGDLVGHYLPVQLAKHEE